MRDEAINTEINIFDLPAEFCFHPVYNFSFTRNIRNINMRVPYANGENFAGSKALSIRPLDNDFFVCGLPISRDWATWNFSDASAIRFSFFGKLSKAIPELRFQILGDNQLILRQEIAQKIYSDWSKIEINIDADTAALGKVKCISFAGSGGKDAVLQISRINLTVNRDTAKL